MEDFLNQLKAQLQEQINAAVKAAYDQGHADGVASVPPAQVLPVDQAIIDEAIAKALGDFKGQLKVAIDAVLALIA